MSGHIAQIDWIRNEAKFTDNQYSRAHTWTFDGGLSIPTSSSPEVVRIPFSNPANVDPEEAFVAALASCHMLWFLSLAAARGFVVDRYTDRAEGLMQKNAAGKPWVARVVLRPHLVVSGPMIPADADIAALHHAAHTECFIANSVKTEIETRSTWQLSG